MQIEFVNCLNILVEFTTNTELADSITMYTITIASFVGLLIILNSSRVKRYRLQSAPGGQTESNKKIKHSSHGKRFNTFKQFFSNENSIFDERNKDGRSGYFPWA
jgi:hypothetical protein